MQQRFGCPVGASTVGAAGCCPIQAALTEFPVRRLHLWPWHWTIIRKSCADYQNHVFVYFFSSAEEMLYFWNRLRLQVFATTSHAQDSPTVLFSCHRMGIFSNLNVEQISKVSIKKVTCSQVGKEVQLLIQQRKRSGGKSEAASCRVHFVCFCHSFWICEMSSSG